MGNLARKIIDAVQNSMLDKLVLRLVPLLWLASIWQSHMSAGDFGVSGALFAATVLIFAFAWLLGAIANSRPPPRRRGLADEYASPPNGFAAWSEPPSGGLQPPRLMRAVVMTLGQGRSTWLALTGFAILLAALGLLWTLDEASASFWPRLHPALAEPSIRRSVWIGLATVVLFFTIRWWAVEQRDRLAPPAIETPRSDWAGYAMLTILVLFLGVAATVFWKVPMWAVAGVAAMVALTALIPAWRTPVLDALFGKRVDPPTPDR